VAVIDVNTDHSTPAPFPAAVSRRRFLSLGGTAAGVAITAGAGAQLGGLTVPPRALAAAKQSARLTGTSSMS
jgi:hypothetical protein